MLSMLSQGTCCRCRKVSQLFPPAVSCPMLLYLLLLLPQVQVPKHVLRVFSDERGQEKVEIQVLLPGEC